MTIYADLARRPVTELPRLIADGLTDYREVQVITSGDVPVCLAVGAGASWLTVHARIASVEPLRLTAAAASEIVNDLVHVVRRVGRFVFITDAPAGREPVVLVPIDWVQILYPRSTPASADRC